MSKYKEQILELAKDGKSIQEIQKQIGCSDGIVRYYLDDRVREKAIANRRAYRSKMRKQVQDYKANKPCFDCGNHYPHYVMDFDHLDADTKVMSVSQMYKHRRWEDVLAEMEKCQIVCANCHRERTQQRLRDNNIIPS